MMVSIVIPVFNEHQSVAELHAELLDVLKMQDFDFEIIFIDDGSTDDTLRVLKTLSPVRVISFARNFGKTQALQAGFAAAKGEYIFTMDGDLQDDPREIPGFLEIMRRERADLVCGWKQNRLDDWGKRLVSRIANALTRITTGTTVHDMNCGYKLYTRELTQSLTLFGDMHRYIPALASAHGFRIAEMPVHHRKRAFGVSKFGNLRRFFKSFFDFVTLILMRRFFDRPMHFFGSIGMLLSCIGGGILVYLTSIKVFLGEAIGHRPLLIMGTLFFVVGIQLFSSGFLGELIIRGNSKKSVYTIRESVDNPA